MPGRINIIDTDFLYSKGFIFCEKYVLTILCMNESVVSMITRLFKEIARTRVRA